LSVFSKVRSSPLVFFRLFKKSSAKHSSKKMFQFSTICHHSLMFLNCRYNSYYIGLKTECHFYAFLRSPRNEKNRKNNYVSIAIWKYKEWWHHIVENWNIFLELCLAEDFLKRRKITRGDDLTFEKTDKLTYHSKQDFEKRYKINEQGFTFEKTNNYITVIIGLNNYRRTKKNKKSSLTPFYLWL
jgi:hypothetical protein